MQLYAHDYVTYDWNICLARKLSSLLALQKQTAMLWAAIWRGPCGKELRMADSQQEIEAHSSFNSLQETEPCQ